MKTYVKRESVDRDLQNCENEKKKLDNCVLQTLPRITITKGAILLVFHSPIRLKKVMQ